MEIEKAFGMVLKLERIQKSFSQEELAHICDLDRTYISMLERGKRQPSLKTIFKLSFALNLLASEMLMKVENVVKE